MAELQEAWRLLDEAGVLAQTRATLMARAAELQHLLTQLPTNAGMQAVVARLAV